MPIKIFADKIYFELLKHVQEDMQAKQEEIIALEQEMEGTCKFVQSNIHHAAAPRGEDQEIQSKEGIYAEFHTQVHLGGMDGATNTRQIKRAVQACCIW